MDEQRPQTQFRKFKNPEQLTRKEMTIAYRMNKTAYTVVKRNYFQST